jgi:hypothetical protein
MAAMVALPQQEWRTRMIPMVIGGASGSAGFARSKRSRGRELLGGGCYGGGEFCWPLELGAWPAVALRKKKEEMSPMSGKRRQGRFLQLR